MTAEPLPYIEEAHYDAIRRVAPNLPETYDAWLMLIERRRRARSTLSFIRLVPVLPAEFVAYCLRQGLTGSLQTLLLFAMDKAAGSDATGQDERGRLDNITEQPEIRRAAR